LGITTAITHVAAEKYDFNSQPIGDLGASLGSALCDFPSIL